MRLTSLPTPLPSNSTQNANTQAETLSSLCSWWMNTKEEALPGICHWFVHPHKNQRRFSLNFEANQSSSNSSFSPVDWTTLEHTSTTSISFILILCTVLFIILVTGFITCITRKKMVQVLFFIIIHISVDGIFNVSATR